jgi:hypothetical protein
MPRTHPQQAACDRLRPPPVVGDVAWSREAVVRQPPIEPDTLHDHGNDASRGVNQMERSVEILIGAFGRVRELVHDVVEGLTLEQLASESMARPTPSGRSSGISRGSKTIT